MAFLIPVGIGVAIVVALIIFFCSIYKVADIDKALIITGGKEPVIKVSGGSFVIPIFRKAQYFDLCMLTVKADKDEIKTIIFLRQTDPGLHTKHRKAESRNQHTD